MSSDSPIYQVRRAARIERVKARGFEHQVRIWGEPQAGVAPLVLLHGWMDVGASYQFVVDAMQADRHIIAPDWRGYGGTPSGCGAVDAYWFADYLADLDFLLDALVGEAEIDLVGHSLGGHVAMMYAGVRPARIRRLVNLEGFGMPRGEGSQSPTRLAKWMDELKTLHRGEMDLKSYDSAEGVARRLMKNNPRLRADFAQWLAGHWAAPDANGQWRILGDPAHKVVNAQLSRVEETLAHYARITAPTLVVVADHSHEQVKAWWQGRYTLEEFGERLKSVPNLERASVADAGHMLHHDQPQRVASLIEAHCAA
jgi:pimeloyl-ACP methyl ester carboxylesterase